MGKKTEPDFFIPMIDSQTLAQMLVLDAAAVWLGTREQQISAGSVRDYQLCIKALSRSFFRDLQLAKIHIGHFEEYQRLRSRGDAELRKAGASRINHELNTLAQILRRAGLWQQIEPHYRPLRLPMSRGRAIESVEEKQYLFSVASSRRKWRVAYLAALLSVNTTAGPNEIRGLQLCDVDLEGDQIHVRLHVKNRYRDRWIPLNRTARWAIVQLLDLARERGCALPTHFLLPHRARGPGERWDPTRPITSWRKAWGALCKEAGKKYPSLVTLRLYDLRHTVITELLENPSNSEETVVALAGWVSAQMKKVYAHVRTRPKRDAVASLDRDKSPVPNSALSWVSFGSTVAGVAGVPAPAPAPAPTNSHHRLQLSQISKIPSEPAGGVEQAGRPKLRLVK